MRLAFGEADMTMFSYSLIFMTTLQILLLFLNKTRKENKIVVMANYRPFVTCNMCLHMLVLCSIFNQCADTFSLLFQATTTCPIQMPACYKKCVFGKHRVYI